MRTPMRFKQVLRAFRSPVKPKVWEETGEWVRGKWTTFANPPRDIKDAIVLALKVQELQFYSAGNASARGISILTQETLWFSDPTSEGVEQQQSFVEWQGYKYRVTGNGQTYPNADFNVYVAMGYTDYGTDRSNP